MKKPAHAFNGVPGSSSRWQVLLLPGFVLLCWGFAVRHLSPEWTLNEQYNYGWIVPLLGAYLVRIRSGSVPVPGPFPVNGWVGAGMLMVAVTGALMLPLSEANPDWRLLGLVLTGLATLATLLAIAQMGGLSWVAHFCFPLLFLFTAVPWPHPVENQVVQQLMQGNALLAAEFVRWLGVAAEVHGKLIRLAHETLGVDEACSGIRSLQGSVMTTLFVGEIFQLTWGRRGCLFLVGVGWALVTNIARTVVLALVMDQGGSAALEHWHNPVGHGIVATCLTGIAVTGWLLQRGKNRRGVTPPPLGRPAMATQWPRRLASQWRTASFASMMLMAGWVGTEIWFRMHEASVDRLVGWSFRQPTGTAAFEVLKQPERVRSNLRYDCYSGGRWKDAEGRRWVVHYFRWEPGSSGASAVLPRHDPRICLSMTGKKLVQTLPVLPCEVGEVYLPFDAYWFREGGEDVFVFNCVAEDVRRRAGFQPAGNVLTPASRLDAVRRGDRNLGHRRLEVAVWGAHDAPSAAQAFLALMHQQLAAEAADRNPQH